MYVNYCFIMPTGCPVSHVNCRHCFPSLSFSLVSHFPFPISFAFHFQLLHSVCVFLIIILVGESVSRRKWQIKNVFRNKAKSESNFMHEQLQIYNELSQYCRSSSKEQHFKVLQLQLLCLFLLKYNLFSTTIDYIDIYICRLYIYFAKMHRRNVHYLIYNSKCII